MAFLMSPLSSTPSLSSLSSMESSLLSVDSSSCSQFSFNNDIPMPIPTLDNHVPPVDHPALSLFRMHLVEIEQIHWACRNRDLAGQFGSRVLGEFLWRLSDVAFLVAHVPMHAVQKIIELVSNTTTADSNTGIISSQDIDIRTTKSFPPICYFSSHLWTLWRSSRLLALCIPRLRSSVDFWARLLDMSEGGTKAIPLFDLDLAFMGAYAWDLLFVGIILLAASIKDDTGSLLDVENAAYLASWRSHLSVLKRTLLIMRKKWSCANAFFHMITRLEKQRDNLSVWVSP